MYSKKYNKLDHFSQNKPTTLTTIVKRLLNNCHSPFLAKELLNSSSVFASYKSMQSLYF